ncbi:sarcosine oxidase subunit delta [Falsiroseomonas sp. E2-1-a20]|uniref:sarcosine oxidase subunit delta n=1 Tax=Falsiroseomonas sp. E2-1-a20 TaxID=3239300 RepID=UPI003F2F4656
MRIPCPFCGPRDSAEFATIGSAPPPRPASDAPFEAWHDYLHLRDNPAGLHEELWQHVQGCRQWLRVMRDTRTHAVDSARACRP